MSDSLRPHGRQPTRLLRSWDFPGKSTGVGCYFLLHGIFQTQGSNPGLPHCRQTLYLLSHQGSPSALKVVSSAYLRLLIFLPAILTAAWASSSLAFHMICAVYRLNKQGDDIPGVTGKFGLLPFVLQGTPLET